MGRGVQGLELQPGPRGQLHRHRQRTRTGVVIEDGLSGCTALFWAPPRGRGPMPRSWRHWAFGQDGKHAGLAYGSAALVLVLHCVNTYKDGCSASEARQAVGGGRGAVVTGTHLAEAIHRLDLWVGGLSHGGRDMNVAARPNCPAACRAVSIEILGVAGSMPRRRAQDPTPSPCRCVRRFPCRRCGR